MELSNENKNDCAVGSPTNYFYFVFNHLHGVYAPNTFPLSDLANNKVSPWPAQIYLNSEL
jgi:hypothetical protein